MRSGSVRIALALPGAEPDEDQLDLAVGTLGEAALTRTLRVASGEDDSPEIAYALARWCHRLGVGAKYNVDVTGHPDFQRVRVDQRVRDRLAEIAARRIADPQMGSVAGILYEANFEDMEARVRTPDGTSATVLFDEQHADVIQEALRSPTTIEGDVTVDAVTMGVRSVRLRNVATPRQFQFHTSAFDVHRSVAELAAEQNVPALGDPEELPSYEMADEEYEAFLAALNG